MNTNLQEHIAKYYDVVFLPLGSYHVWTMCLISRQLKERGFSSCLLDLTDYCGYPDGRNKAKEFSDVPFLDYSELLEGNIDYNTIVCMNDWDKKVINKRIRFDKKRGKNTIGIIEGINDFLDQDTKRKRKPYRTVEFLLLSGKHDKQFFKKKKTKVIGIPRLEELSLSSVDEVNKPLALINVNFTYGVLESKRQMWLESAIRGCEKACIDYVISQHPADNADLSKYNVSKDNIYSLISKSSIFISRFSSSILEALVLGKPVVYHNPHMEKVKKFQEPLGAYSLSFNSDDLASAIKYELSLSNDYRSRASEFLDLHCNINQDSATSLAVDAIIEIMTEEKCKKNKVFKWL